MSPSKTVGVVPADNENDAGSGELCTGEIWLQSQPKGDVWDSSLEMHTWGVNPTALFALAVGGGGIPWAAVSSPLELHTALSIPPWGIPRSPMAACITHRLASSCPKSVPDVESSTAKSSTFQPLGAFVAKAARLQWGSWLALSTTGASAFVQARLPLMGV